MAVRVSSVLVLNEKAISLIRQRDYKLATQHLGEAISTLQTLIRTAQQELNENDDANEDLGVHHLLIEAQPVSSCGRAGGATSAENDDDDDESVVNLLSAFSLFDKLMSIRADGISSDQQLLESSRDRTFFSALLLYNMGLCFQLYALSSGEPRESLLERSNRIYFSALAALANNNNNANNGEQQQQQGGRDQSELLLEFAALNNCGYTFYSLMNKSATGQCLERMAHLLNHVSAEGATTRTTRPGPALPEPFMFFFLNIFHNQGHWTRPSPSA